MAHAPPGSHAGSKYGHARKNGGTEQNVLRSLKSAAVPRAQNPDALAGVAGNVNQVMAEINRKNADYQRHH